MKRDMKLQYFSDLHLEFFKKQKFDHLIQAKAPILVLCGDIGDVERHLYEAFLHNVSGKFDKIF
jgi:Icc-related predicted phosphoesterase